ncbi:MAG: hypothetical protein U0670_12305 [Anaerolineae bacterium]
MPTLAIDYTPAYQQGAGIGRLVRDLVAALARQDHQNSYRLFVAGARKLQLPAPPATNFAWCSTPIGVEWWARIWQRAQIPLPVEAMVGNVDIYHATDFVLPPTRRHTRTLLTVHDLTYAPRARDSQPVA